MTDVAIPAGVDAAAIQAASDWAFDRDSEFQDTLSLIIVHDGEIIHERYAPGVDMLTKPRTWSTARSPTCSQRACAPPIWPPKARTR